MDIIEFPTAYESKIRVKQVIDNQIINRELKVILPLLETAIHDNRFYVDLSTVVVSSCTAEYLMTQKGYVFKGKFLHFENATDNRSYQDR